MAGTPRKKARLNSGEALQVRQDAFARLVSSGSSEANTCKILMLSKAEYVSWLAEHKGRIEALGGKPEFPPMFYELRARLLSVIAYADEEKTLEAARLLIELMKRAAKLGPVQTKAVMDLSADAYFGELEAAIKNELGVIDVLKLKQRARDERLEVKRGHKEEKLVEPGEDKVVDSVVKELMDIEV